jgi:hypothetical protein
MNRIALYSTKNEYAEAIHNEWRNALASIIRVGRLLREAADTLGNKDFHTLITTDLPFSLRTAEKLMTIASDKRLINPKYAKVLPPYWTSLHELTYLDDNAFYEGIELGVISADVERKDIVAYRKRCDDATLKPPAPITATSLDKLKNPLENEKHRIATLYTESPMAIWQEDQLKTELENLIQKYKFISYEQHINKPVSADISARRGELAAKKKKWLEKRTKSYNKGVDEEYLELLSDAFYQRKADRHFVVADGEDLPLNDIRNPKNPFHNMNYGQLFKLCRNKKILTQYTNLEVIDYQAFMNTLVLQHCEGSETIREKIHQTIVRRTKSRNPNNKKMAISALAELII